MAGKSKPSLSRPPSAGACWPGGRFSTQIRPGFQLRSSSSLPGAGRTSCPSGICPGTVPRPGQARVPPPTPLGHRSSPLLCCLIHCFLSTSAFLSPHGPCPGPQTSLLHGLTGPLTCPSGRVQTQTPGFPPADLSPSSAQQMESSFCDCSGQTPRHPCPLSFTPQSSHQPASLPNMAGTDQLSAPARCTPISPPAPATAPRVSLLSTTRCRRKVCGLSP